MCVCSRALWLDFKDGCIGIVSFLNSVSCRVSSSLSCSSHPDFPQTDVSPRASAIRNREGSLG